jgi:erythromycin esterase
MKSILGLTIIFFALSFSVLGQSNQSDILKPIVQVSLTDKVDDLSYLDKWVGKRKVIGLGEVTHGSKEIFEFKVRLVQYLALKKNAKAIVIEANMSDCYDINKFITKGEGNPSELIKNLKIATLNYKELVDLLTLLKDINKTRKLNDKIEFWGYDVQAPQSAAKMALAFFEKSGLSLSDSIKTGVNEFINTGKSIFSINPKNVETYSKFIESFYTTFQANKEMLIKNSNEADYFFNERLIYSIKQSFMLFTAKSQMDAFFMRDKLGFDNIKWIVENKKKYPVVYWAHNAHVLKKELFYDNFITTGNCLANEFKSDYLAIGSVFYEGSVKAIKDEKKPKYEAIDLPVADTTSAETFFSKQKFENFFLNISQAAQSVIWKKVLTDSTTIRSIGSAYQPNEPGRNYRKTIFNQQFDLVFFIRKSSTPTENK